MGSKNAATGTAKTNSKEVKAAKAKKGEKAASEKPADGRAERHPELLREPLIDKALEDNGLERTGKVLEKAERLDAHYRNTIPSKVIAECDCGFGSDPELPACPFCGDTAIDERDEEAFEEARAGKDVTAPPGKAPAPMAKAAPTEIVEPGPERNASAEKLAELDAAIENVKEAHAAGIGSYWDLGQALRPIHEGQLYFQRLDESGAPKYRSWEQFLAAEFGGQITGGHSYRVMAVAKKFDRPTAIAIGVAKLAILERAKDEAMPKLLEAARVQTVKELAKTAAPYLHEAGSRPSSQPADAPPRRGSGTSPGSRAAREEGRAQASYIAEKTENKITVSTMLGETVVHLFKKADMKTRAKVLRDEPVGVEVHMNGVETRYFIDMLGEGGLALRVVRTRAKSGRAS
jgi:hypothetical protein